jgi:hypothetical protein
VAIGSRQIQWSALTEESKRMNLLQENDGKNEGQSGLEGNYR